MLTALIITIEILGIVLSQKGIINPVALDTFWFLLSVSGITLTVDFLTLGRELRRLSVQKTGVHRSQWYLTSLFSSLGDICLSINYSLRNAKDREALGEKKDSIPELFGDPTSGYRTIPELLHSYTPVLPHFTQCSSLKLFEFHREKGGRFALGGGGEPVSEENDFLTQMLREYLSEKLTLESGTLGEFFTSFRDPALPLERLGYEGNLFVLLPVDRDYFVWWFGYKTAGEPSPGVIEFLQKTFLKICRSEVEKKQREIELEHSLCESNSIREGQQEIVNSISHDVRSPLNNIQTILYLFQQGNLSGDEYQEMIKTALKNCYSAGEILETILNFSAMTTGKLSPRIDTVELRDILTDVFEVYKVEAQSKNLSLELSAFESCIISADRVFVKRILANLISNAIKYTEEGSIRIEMTRRGRAAIDISVTDTGSGMSREELQRIATPFSRFGSSSVEGLGLGLALSKGMAASLKMNLEFKSKKGRGTTAQVQIPQRIVRTFSEEKITLTTAPIEPVRSRAEIFRASAARSIAASALGKIVYVDDDVDCRESIGRALEGLGWQVLRASNVGEAQALLICNPDTTHLMTDDSLQEGDGLALIRWAQLQCEQKRDEFPRELNCAVLSGKNLRILDQKYGAFIRTFSKPADFTAIAAWLDEGRQEREAELQAV